MGTNLEVERVIRTDVLIVGGGGAACRAAVAAHDAGAEVVMALKGEMGTSGATVAPGRGVAWQAADECAGPMDSPANHYRNIVDVGLGMADQALARILAFEIVDRMEELEGWGLRFAPDPEGKKRHLSAYSCFGDQPRAHCIWNSGHGHAGDIVMVLKRQMGTREIAVHENVFVTDVLVEDGRCRGALALGPDGQLFAYQAGAVVLATGGARHLFPRMGRAPIDTTGDGYAMALRAGAELTNMEFAQYMLGAFVHTPMSVPGSSWALFPKLLDRQGEEILARYLPPGVTREQAMWDRTQHAPFSCRDASGWLDIAVATELREGRGTDEGGILVDYSDVDLSHFTPSRPTVLHPLDYSQPVVLPEGRAQVRNYAHACNGGIRINERTESTLSGLFAAGETAAGAHGADRLGGGMVTNCQVFGERAGRFSGQDASAGASMPLSSGSIRAARARLLRYGQGTRDAEEIFSALQNETKTHLVVVKNAGGLEHLLARIAELRDEWLPQVTVDSPSALRRAVEAENALLAAEVMARAALLREESRGSHYREDHPRRDDEHWLTSTVFWRKDGSLAHRRERLTKP